MGLMESLRLKFSDLLKNKRYDFHYFNPVFTSIDIELEKVPYEKKKFSDKLVTSCIIHPPEFERTYVEDGGYPFKSWQS